MEDIYTAQIDNVHYDLDEDCILEHVDFWSQKKQVFRYHAKKQLKMPLFYSEPEFCRADAGTAQSRLYNLVRAHWQDFLHGQEVPLYYMRPETGSVVPDEDAFQLVSDVQIVNLRKGEYTGRFLPYTMLEKRKELETRSHF